MLSTGKRKKRAHKRKQHGGHRYKGTFFERRQKAMDMDVIKSIWEYECGCKPDCLFTVANDLPNFLDVVENLRAARFTGKTS